MSRFYFNTADGVRQRDTEGLELPSLSVARREAIRFAGALLDEDPDLLLDGHEFRVIVTDDSRRTVVTIIMLAVDAEFA